MKNINRNMLLMGIINPLLYYINPYLLLVSIIVELFITIKYSSSLEEKLWKSFILSSAYFGIQLIGLKLYDIILIGFLPIIIIKNYKKLLNKDKKIFSNIIIIFVYLLYLTFVILKNKLQINSILEYIRYIMAFITIISFLLTVNKFENFKKVIDIMPLYALRTFLNGIFIMILIMLLNMKTDVNMGIIKIKIYNSLPEFRLTGFFSDPNKYFLFFIIMLIIYELYNYLYNYKNIKLIDKNNIIFIIGAISSFSRAGIISILLYLVLKYINIKFFYDKQDKFLKYIILLIIIIVILIIIFPNFIINIIDRGIYLITIAMGREESLIYSSSLSNSSRVLSWNVALKSVSDSIITGNGLFSWHEFYYMPPHNTFVSIIQDTGIIGIVIFLSLLYYIFKSMPIHITLVLLLIPIMMFDLQNYRLLYLLIAICASLSIEKISFNKFKK